MKLKDSTHAHSLRLMAHDCLKKGPFTRQYRQQLYNDTFNSFAAVIETLLDTQADLTAGARLILCDALTHPHHFVALLLPSFYEQETLRLCCNHGDQMDHVYSEYRRRLSLSRSSPR